MKIDPLPIIEDVERPSQLKIPMQSKKKTIYLWGAAAAVLIAIFYTGSNFYGLTHHGSGMHDTTHTVLVHGKKVSIQVTEGPKRIDWSYHPSQKSKPQPGVVVIGQGN